MQDKDSTIEVVKETMSGQPISPDFKDYLLSYAK